MSGDMTSVRKPRMYLGDSTGCCTLERADDGWRLLGHARWQDTQEDAGDLGHEGACDDGRQSLWVNVSGIFDGRKTPLCAGRSRDSRTLNGTSQPEQERRTDIALDFTARIDAHSSGFVLLNAGLWQGQVDA